MALVHAPKPGPGPKTHICGNCREHHTLGRTQCLAYGATCPSSLKMGHFKRCCRGKLSTVSSAVVDATVGLSRQPKLQVAVEWEKGCSPTKSVLAVADTGAMVYVAGPFLL